MGHTELGRAGESLALAYLEEKGMRCAARNFRRLHGELDLVMEDGRTLVFVEVKTRRSLRLGTPAEAVTPAKQRHLRWCAEAYCAEHRVEGRPIRFDVVEVLALPGRPPRLRHIPDAF